MLIWRSLAPSRLAKVLAWLFGRRRRGAERAALYAAPASQSIRD
jgi:hypothetical protein